MNDDRLKLYFTISEVAGILTAALGLFALTGWIFNIQLMKSILPGFVTMKPNAAACFTLIGSSLWFLQAKRINDRRLRTIGKACASIVAAIGAVTLYEYISGNDLGVDQLLFKEAAGAIFTPHAGRMALITAINFILAGGALLSVDTKTKRGYYPSQYLAIIFGFIALGAFYGYIYGVGAFYGEISKYTAMAIHTTIAFILLSLGTLFARPDKASADVITSTLSGGTMMRRLLLLIILVPMISGWLKLQGENAGFYNSRFGTALMVLVSVALLTAIIWWTAAIINRSERKRESAETNLNAADEEWKMTFDSMSDPAFIMDMDNTIRNVNIASTKVLGKSADEIIGKKCYEIMHGANAPFANCPMEATRRDGKPHIEEVNDPHIGIPLLVTTSPILDKANRVVGVVHVAKDISFMKKAEEALRESETKYRAIFEASADAIMLLAQEGVFLGVNPTAIRLFGCKDENDLISKTPEALSPEYQPDGQLSLTKSREMMRLAVERGSNFFEWTHRRATGVDFIATVLLTSMDLGGKKVLQAVIHDITERVSSEKQLAKKLRDMEIFYKAAIDREMKIKELKKQVQELEAKIKE